MPQRTPTPCRIRGCLNLTRNPKGHCDTHAEHNQAWAPNRNRSSSERGYGWAWQKVRVLALKRDHYLCVSHRAKGIMVEATDVDHIVPKSQGGTDDLSNLQSLCKACHKFKTHGESLAPRMNHITK